MMNDCKICGTKKSASNASELVRMTFKQYPATLELLQYYSHCVVCGGWTGYEHNKKNKKSYCEGLETIELVSIPYSEFELFVQGMYHVRY